MHAWDKPEKSENACEPMFRPQNYGHICNLKNETVLNEYIKFKKSINDAHFPISDLQFLDFEIEFARNHRKEIKVFINEYGGIEVAQATLTAMSKPSYLINYYAEKKKEREKRENTFPASYRLETCTADSA